MITTNYECSCEKLIDSHQLDDIPNTDESSPENDDNTDDASKRKEQQVLNKTVGLFQHHFVLSYNSANYSSITKEKGNSIRIIQTKLISQPMNLTEIFKTAHHLLIVLISYTVLTCCASSATSLLTSPKLSGLLSSTSISQPASAPDAHHLDPQQYFTAQQHYAQQQLYDNNSELKQAIINTNYMTDTNTRSRRASTIGSNIDQQQQQQQWINNLLQAASETEQQQQLESQEVNFNQASYGIPSAPQQQHQRLHIQDQKQKQQQHYQQHAGSTVPTINRQLITPPQFYELGLAPTNALQIELNGSENSDSRDLLMAAQTQQRSTGARSLSFNTNRQDPTLYQQQPQQISQNSRSQDVAPNSAQQDGSTFEQESGSNNKVANIDSSSNLDPKLQADSTEAKNSVSSETDDNKAIEPRQRRRIFNRILKKAEWNHLFVELSKVFLRYFLDLALKDIIGKQSGGETTTSRKKLDAQSELADLLKDFVKTAISNI